MRSATSTNRFNSIVLRSGMLNRPLRGFDTSQHLNGSTYPETRFSLAREVVISTIKPRSPIGDATNHAHNRKPGLSSRGCRLVFARIQALLLLWQLGRSHAIQPSERIAAFDSLPKLIHNRTNEAAVKPQKDHLALDSRVKQTRIGLLSTGWKLTFPTSHF